VRFALAKLPSATSTPPPAVTSTSTATTSVKPIRERERRIGSESVLHELRVSEDAAPGMVTEGRGREALRLR